MSANKNARSVQVKVSYSQKKNEKNQRNFREKQGRLYSFTIFARKPTLLSPGYTDKYSVDGHADPVYEPTPIAPDFFRWKGWMLSVVSIYTHISFELPVKPTRSNQNSR